MGARVIVLRAAGTNCDRETLHAWRLAGAAPDRTHIRGVIENPRLLADYQILTVPGGFSYGDDIAAGRVFAAQVARYLSDELRKFVDAGKLVLGICNGFQVLVQAGLLGHDEQGRRVASIAFNDPQRFQDRWVTLRGEDSPCVFTEPGRVYQMPIAHGEGRVFFESDSALHCVLSRKLRAVSYIASADNAADGPANPNNSQGDIAGLCDSTGRVFGLMPHPERFVDWTQHPRWTSLPPREFGDGLAIFRRALDLFR